MGCQVAIVNKMVNLGLIEKMTLEQRLEGDEEVSQADTWEWEVPIPVTETKHCKTYGGRMPGVLQEGQGGQSTWNRMRTEESVRRKN